ncbi:MAG: membrane dipeptidase, partial [Chloroflexota bacterium]
YNLEDWEIKWIADHGGIVGVIFMNYWLQPHQGKQGLNYISRTIEHVIEVGGGKPKGEDVIAIGTDFDGFTDPPDELAHYGQLPQLTKRLMAEYLSAGQNGDKYPDYLIEKILGENALRVLLKGWGKKRQQ